MVVQGASGSARTGSGSRCRSSTACGATATALPAATVCYVWDPSLPVGTVLDNVYSRRLRVVVVRGQGDPLGAWADERRDVVADLRRLFADELGTVLPPLSAVAVSGDADNTGADSLGYVATLAWQP